MDIILYESETSRSARCRWTLLEAGLSYQSMTRSDLTKIEKTSGIYPVGKLPLAIVDGKFLFESAAISTYIADNSEAIDLIAKPGTWARTQHDQWISFALTEMEAWLWNSAVNTFVLPKSERVTAGFEQNALMFKRSANFLNKFLLEKNYLVEDRFTVTDIIVSWTINWGRRQGLLENMEGLNEYLKRLFKRQNCALAKD